MASLTNDEILIPPKQRRLLSVEGRELLKRVLSDDTAENLFNPELMLNKTVRMKNFNNTLTGKKGKPSYNSKKSTRQSLRSAGSYSPYIRKTKKHIVQKKKEMEKKQLDNEHKEYIFKDSKKPIVLPPKAERKVSWKKYVPYHTRDNTNTFNQAANQYKWFKKTKD